MSRTHAGAVSGYAHCRTSFGSPARVKRALTEEEKRQVQEGVDRYVRLGREHR